jgi:hypothetical protein
MKKENVFCVYYAASRRQAVINEIYTLLKPFSGLIAKKAARWALPWLLSLNWFINTAMVCFLRRYIPGRFLISI